MTRLWSANRLGLNPGPRRTLKVIIMHRIFLPRVDADAHSPFFANTMRDCPGSETLRASGRWAPVGLEFGSG